jgi:hypothetical protein
MASIETIRSAANDPNKSPESRPPSSHPVAPHAHSLKPRNHGFHADARVFETPPKFSPDAKNLRHQLNSIPGLILL